MRALGGPEGVGGRRRNAIGRPPEVLGRRRTIVSGDGGMFELVVNGRVGWVSGAESSGWAFSD